MDDKYRYITLYDINFSRDREVSRKLSCILDRAYEEFDKNKFIDHTSYIEEINIIISSYNSNIQNLTKEMLEIAIYNTLNKINCGLHSSYDLF
jgi:hypothetical protein